MEGVNMNNSSDITCELMNIKKRKTRNEIFAKKVENGLELEFINCLNSAINNIEEEVIAKQFSLYAS